MIITVIADDGLVGVNGVFRAVDLAALEADIHAIQFDTVAGRGEIEYRRDPLRPQGNRAITEFAPWQWAFDAWAAAAPPPPAPPAPEDVRAGLVRAVQIHLDATARSRGYDSILSACSYAGAPNPYRAEGEAYLAWRGAVWAHGYQVLRDVQANSRPVPTAAELIAELPALVLP